MTYRYPHFHLGLLAEDQQFRGGPRPGETFPDFELVTTDGRRVRRDELLRDKPLLVLFGSFT